MKRVSKRNSRGQALVEFTLLLPFIIILVGGLTDLGLAFYVSISTQNAVREGARIASATANLGANSTTIRTEVEGRIPDIGQFPRSQVTVTNTNPSGDLTCASVVTVTATGTYSFAFLRYIGFTDMTISRSTTMRYEIDRPLC
ncbi:MAG: TadE/TadG family type IV pilus assembly protein [Candidatus Binatia bacterium]